MDKQSELYEDMLTMDGYDDCIVGIVERFEQENIFCYDKEKVLAKLMADGMDEEEAIDFFYYNQLGAWMGEGTPCFLNFINLNNDHATDSPNMNTPQPISTAPKDGTEVLAWTGGTWEMAFWSREHKRWFGSHHSCTHGNELHYITHWFPMPPEPTQ